MRGLEDLSTLGGVISLAVSSQMEVKAMLSARIEEHTEIKIGAGDMLALFDSGATLACNSLHRWHPGIRRWVALMAQSLVGTSDLGYCNLYVTPAGRGVPLHFDDHEIIVVQLAGKKVWTFAPNTNVIYPTSNSGRVFTDMVKRYAVGAIPKSIPQPSKKAIMLPGSVLFLPRGYWHQTDALELSISITFGFRTPCWAELLSGYLMQKLILESAWREPAWNIYRKDANLSDLDQRWQSRRAELEESIRHIAATDLVEPMHVSAKELFDGYASNPRPPTKKPNK